MLSHFRSIQLFATLRTVAHQVHLSMRFSWQEYWSGLPFSTPGDLPDPGIEPRSASPALEGEFFTTVPPSLPQLVPFKYGIHFGYLKINS